MPQIREYRSDISAQTQLNTRGAQPGDFGHEGVSALGQGVQVGGSRFAEMQRIQNQRKAAAEVTRIDMDIARANAELAVQLQTMAKNWKPEDGNLVEGFQDIVRKRMEGIAYSEDGTHRYETEAGLQHWQRKSTDLSGRFLVAAAETESHVLGQQVVTEHVKFIDDMANQAQLNPDNHDVHKSMIAEIIDNPNGRYAVLPHAKREELKQAAIQAVARSSGEGAIRTAPRNALAALESGWLSRDLRDTDYTALLKEAKTAVHALDVDKDRAYAEEERQRRRVAREITSKLLDKMAAHDADPTNPPLTARDLLDSGLGKYDDNGYQSLIGILHARSKEGADHQVATDPKTFMDLFERIHLPPGHPKRLADEIAIQDAFGKKGKLSFTDMTRLRREFQDARTPEGERLGMVKKEVLDGLRTQITKSNMLMGKIDQDGDMQYLLFHRMVDRKIEEYRKAKKDPHDLFDPSKPDWIGKPEILAQYKKTMQQSIKDFSGKMRQEQNKAPVIPPEKMPNKGESWLEWKKRVNP